MGLVPVLWMNMGGVGIWIMDEYGWVWSLDYVRIMVGLVPGLWMNTGGIGPWVMNEYGSGWSLDFLL